MKQQLYILSLLRRIPETNIQAYYSAVFGELGAQGERATQILDLAEKLARGNQPPTPTQVLRSPLECLSGQTSRHIVEVQEVGLSDACFPVSEAKGNKTAMDLWKAFAADFQRVQNAASLEILAETTLHLLHRYAANLPNYTGAAAEISWYDFAKNMAGVTVAICEYLGDEKAVEVKNEEMPLLLIGGDLSGIQQYITAIISKGASKNLKGRSFYLHMLTESVVIRLLSELGLFRANVVYASGGSFYILAPNTAKCKKDFAEAVRTIGNKIYALHKNTLALIMDSTEIRISELSQVNVCFDRLMDTLEIKKRQKSSHIVIASFDELFNDGVDTGGNRRRDAISGEEISDKEDFYLDVDDEARTRGYEFRPAGSKMPDNQGVLKTTTYQQIALGRQLRDLDYWAFTTTKPNKKQDHEDPEYYDPCDLGVYHFLGENKAPSDATVLTINKVAFLPTSPSPQNIYGFTFYGGNQAPPFPGTDKVLSFSLMTIRDNEDLAKAEVKIEKEGSFGYFRRLGVLRMDVDNLGAIFRDGVPGNRSTFAFYSALSRSLDWFFKGYLNTIWKNEGFDKRSQIIYSGGDDLFIVGRWDMMMHFAKRIADDFGRYNGQNPKLGISGGVAVVTHKFPVIKASTLAGAAEKKAKKHRHKAGKEGLKNAFTIMGEPLHWQENGSANVLNCEYALVAHLKDEIKSLGAANTQLGRGFCQRIQSYHAIKEAVSNRPKSAYDRSGDQYRWKWLIAYDFVRLKERLKIKEHSKEAKFLDELQQSTFTGQYKQNPVPTHYEFIDLLNLAARWAELEYRSQD